MSRKNCVAASLKQEAAINVRGVSSHNNRKSTYFIDKEMYCYVCAGINS